MDTTYKVNSDTAFTAKYRKLQSDYRVNILKTPAGFGPYVNSTGKLCNMLVSGEKTGLNFISDSAFRFAKQKVLDKQINREMTIDEFRLFNNMLSSMPMCFNLFSDLRELLLTNQDESSKIIKSIFKELDWIEEVTYIDVEFIPVPIADFTNDKSAFDAMILVKDSNGKKGLISIETKYTDLLGSNTSKNTEIKDNLIEQNKIFDIGLVNQLKVKGYKQIHRNYLLTYAYAKKNKFKHFANIIISPKDDTLSVKEIDQLKTHLLLKEDTILKIPLEDVIKRGLESNNSYISTVLKKFKQRYLV